MASLRLRVARIRSVGAVLNLGRRRASSGDHAGAAEAFLLAATSRNTRYNIPAALHLWTLRSEANDLRAADEAYLLAVDLAAKSGLDKTVAEKSLRLGCHIAAYQREFVRPARRAFHRSIDSEDPESAPLAALGLAGLEMQEMEESYGAVDAAASKAAIKTALQCAIDSGHPDYIPVAAGWLATVSERTGDIDAARIALRAAIDSDDLDRACHAALDVCKLFKREGHTAEAITALRFVVDNSQTGSATVASEYLAELLAEQGDIEGARAAYQFVLDRSTFPHVIKTVRAALDRL